MQHEASIRLELDELARLLEARRHLPAAYSRALQDSAWLRSQIAAGGQQRAPTSGRRRWVPAVAAASMVAGLVTAPPGYALPAPQLPGFIGAGVDIPPPPVLLAPRLEFGPVASQQQAEAVPEARPIDGAPPAVPDVPAGAVPEPAQPLPDQSLKLPFEAEEIRPEVAVQATPAGEAAQPARKARAKRGRTAVAPVPRTPLRWHTIKPGETLIKLARRYYQGAGSHWRGLFAVNKDRVRDADRIYPGDRIVIPTLAEAIAAERGQVPILAAAEVPEQRLADTSRTRRASRGRHKTRVAHRDPILRPRPGLPI